MFTITNVRGVLTSLWGRIIALSVVAVAGLSLATAAPASAQPNNGPAVIKGYRPVEDEYGHVFYVPAGTRIGIVVCGEDGYWHFGWLITGRTGGGTTGLTPLNPGQAITTGSATIAQ